MKDTPAADIADLYLAGRAELIDTVCHILAHHRPERIPEQRIVTCTKVYDEQPHARITTQWPGWRDHVAPLIVDAILALLIPAAQGKSHDRG